MQVRGGCPNIQLPSEVWAIVFGYAVPVGAGLEPDQISQFRLLSRSIAAGLDEWTVEGIDQGLGKDGSLVLSRTDLDGTDAPTLTQKWALLVLSKAPKEFLSAITKLQGPDLIASSNLTVQGTAAEQCIAAQTLNSILSALTGLTSIEGPFRPFGSCLQTVDLSSMTQLTAIGSDVLCYSYLVKLLLPPTLKSIGNLFLAEASIEELDLSHTVLETVGDNFLKACLVDELLLPKSLKSVGKFFLFDVTTHVVHLCARGLEKIGDYFLCFFHADQVLLMRSFESMRRNVFLHAGDLPRSFLLGTWLQVPLRSQHRRSSSTLVLGERRKPRRP